MDAALGEISIARPPGITRVTPERNSLAIVCTRSHRPPAFWDRDAAAT